MIRPVRNGAHPRAGGADGPAGTAGPLALGSSPRGRGGLGEIPERLESGGLIPARAGRTTACCTVLSTSRAHPRAGGADYEPESDCLVLTGSSPRGRGGLLAQVEGAVAPGLIPARAGRTASACRRHPIRRAHPRAGGADSEGPDSDTLRRGSSPRGRGGRVPPDQAVAVSGLIPARAGRTPTFIRPAFGGAGSSPRGRGGREVLAEDHPGLGLIPARAGRTWKGSPKGFGKGAHPRAGGADSSFARPASVWMGSSPRGRGGRRMVRPHARSVGLIPARAGRTARRTRGSRSPRAHPRAGGADPAEVGHRRCP